MDVLLDEDGWINTGEFFILLNGGGRSWKRITISPQMDKNGNNKWDIVNEIDESHQVLTDKNLFNKRFTNIGEAMQQGSFYFAWV